MRAGEPCPDAIVSLWKDAGALRLELAPLDEASTEQLVETVLDGPVEQSVGQWVYESSQGNPLYIRELLLGALESGSLTQVRGLWRLPAAAAASRSRSATWSPSAWPGSSDGERRAIELLAFGEPLSLSLVVELAGAEPLALAETHRMVTVDAPSDGGAVRLAHPIYGEVMRASLPAALARELRLRLAAAVEARGELGAADALRVARWLLDAGEPVDRDLLVFAARAALRAGDPELGAELSALALDAKGGFEAALLLARAHTRRKRFEEAEAVLIAAEDGISTAGGGARVPRAANLVPLLGPAPARRAAGAARPRRGLVARCRLAAAAHPAAAVRRIARRPLGRPRRAVRAPCSPYPTSTRRSAARSSRCTSPTSSTRAGRRRPTSSRGASSRPSRSPARTTRWRSPCTGRSRSRRDAAGPSSTPA